MSHKPNGSFQNSTTALQDLDSGRNFLEKLCNPRKKHSSQKYSAVNAKKCVTFVEERLDGPRDFT